MKKKLVVCLMVASMSLAVAGCSKKESAKDTNTKEVTEGSTQEVTENISESEEPTEEVSQDTTEEVSETEELTEKTVQLADNEILCSNDFDTPCSKVTVTMPEEYKVTEKGDGHIYYESDNGNGINIYFHDSAENYIQFQIGQGNLSNATEVENTTGSIISDDNLEWLWIQQKLIYHEDEDYCDNILVFVADLPTHDDRDCCIVVKIYNHYDYEGDGELLAENFSDLISASAIKIEKYE